MLRALVLALLLPGAALADASPPAPASASGGCVRGWVARIDDQPDPLHLDVTPAVLALGACGLEGARAVLPLLGAQRGETRMHAERALSYGVARWLGWRAGVGFPWHAAERFRALWQANGYSWDMPPEARGPAIGRWRDWLARAR
jgi:hypothetical protein